MVLSRVLWYVAILTQLMLSSNVLHMTFGVDSYIGKPHDFKSSIKCIIAITSRSVDDKTMYSASVELGPIFALL